MRKKKPVNRFSHETTSRESEHEMPGGGMEEENGAGSKVSSFAMGGGQGEGRRLPSGSPPPATGTVRESPPVVKGQDSKSPFGDEGNQTPMMITGHT